MATTNPPVTTSAAAVTLPTTSVAAATSSSAPAVVSSSATTVSGVTSSSGLAATTPGAVTNSSLTTLSPTTTTLRTTTKTTVRTVAATTTSISIIPQQVPNANSGSASPDLTSSNSKSFPLYAIVILAVVGGLVFLFIASRLWVGSWRLWRKKPSEESLPPPRASVFDPLNEKDFRAPSFTPGKDWDSIGFGSSTQDGSRTGKSTSMLLKDNEFYGNEKNEKRHSVLNMEYADVTPTALPDSELIPPPKIGTEKAESSVESVSTNSSPVATEFAPLPEPLSGGSSRNASSQHIPQASSSSSSSSRGASPSPVPKPRLHEGNRNSYYGSQGNRRSVYAMSLYATPHHDPSSQTSFNRPQSGFSNFAIPNPNNRLSGAPHSRNSRIELSVPQPLGPPPGTVAAVDKSRLGFTDLSGIKGNDENSVEVVADEDREGWLKEIVDDSSKRVEKEVEEVLKERARSGSISSSVPLSRTGTVSNSISGPSNSESERDRTDSNRDPSTDISHQRSISVASSIRNVPTGINNPFNTSTNASGRTTPYKDPSFELSSAENLGMTVDGVGFGENSKSPLDRLKRELTKGKGSARGTNGSSTAQLDDVLSGKVETPSPASSQPQSPLQAEISIPNPPTSSSS